MKWLKTWTSLMACCSCVLLRPTDGFFMSDSESRTRENGDVVAALNNIVQALDSHERHTALYERVSMLEENLKKKTESERKLESEVMDLRSKIPLLEAEIETIPEMRKDLAEFEAKIEKLVHDYEAKLSALASEVIRLKKYGAKRKDLQTLSDGSDNVLLRIDAPTCPEVGLGMAAERVGDQCLYFSWGTPLNWTDAHRQCQSMGGDLSAPEDLLPLKTFLHTAFARGPSIWLGASYKIDDDGNITHNITGGKVMSTLESSSESPDVVSAGEDHDLRLSSSFSIVGTPELAVNSIDGDERHEDSQDDDPSSHLLSDGLPLRDEASTGEIIGDVGSLSHRFLNWEGLFGSMSEEELNSRLQRRSKPPVVDFILLKDPVNSMDSTVSTAEEKRPPGDVNLGKTTELESKTRTHSLFADSSLEIVNGSVSPGVSRDVREVPEESEGNLDSGTSPVQEEDSKTTGKAKMNCMLLQQKESLEYELVGMPCNEQHRFVCEILSVKNTDLKFTPENLIHE